MEETGQKRRRRPGLSRLAAGIFVAVFGLMLAGIFLATLLHPVERVSVWENRALAEFPPPERESILDGSWFQKLEAFLCDHAAGRTATLKVLARGDLDVLHRPVVNEIVPTQEALLPWWDYEKMEEEELERQAEEMAEGLLQVKEETERHGGTFLYVAVPSQNAFWGENYPWYLNSRVEYAADARSALFRALEERDIPYLDIGTVWAGEGNPPSFFSRGDHHWTLAGCLCATRGILADLSRRTGLPLSIPEDEELVIRTLPNPLLGSRARYLYGARDTGEHLSWAEPARPVPFTRRDDGAEVAPELLAFPPTETEPVSYSFYMGGDVAETVLETRRPEKPSCLLFGDSFTNLLETVLYPAFDETCSLDLRLQEDLSLLEQIRTREPEVVLCIRDYMNLLTLTGNGAIR